MNNITIPTSQDYGVWHNEDFYIDKTYIMIYFKKALKTGSAFFFARPRRWGKSLFLSTLKYFFDKDLYKEEYFSNKLVWQDKDLPKMAGTYLTISLDLKPVYDINTNKVKFDELFMALINQIPASYVKKIFGFEKGSTDIDIKELVIKLKPYYPNIGTLLTTVVSRIAKEEKVLLLIDEYDKPINDCLKTHKDEAKAKQVLEDLKNHLYAYLKNIDCITVITGVNKLSMSSFFSEFNNLKDYSQFINIGFTLTEVQSLFARLNVDYSNEIEKWYNGYYFKNSQEFNPWAITSWLETKDFLAYWAKTGTSPEYFRYLLKTVLKIDNMEQYLQFLSKPKLKFNDEIINLEFINDMNPSIIMHYFYYAGLLSVNPQTNQFFVPNNDVITSYKELLFTSGYTAFYTDLKTKLVDMLEHWGQTEFTIDFIKYLLNEKYNNLDKTSLNEQVIVSDIALLMRTYSRNDIQRETNILTGRTDLEFIDKFNKRNVVEFKIAKSNSALSKKREPAEKQMQKYLATGKYDQGIIILINVKTVEVEVRQGCLTLTNGVILNKAKRSEESR